LKIDEESQRALKILQEVLEDKGVTACLIGATVPDLTLAVPLGINARPTEDFDSAIKVSSWEKFESLKERLVEKGYTKNVLPHRMHFGDHTTIDIIPYGPDIVKDNKIEWPHNGPIMNVAGFDQLFDYAEPKEIFPGMKWLVPPLPLFVLLKLACYEDRKFNRDLADIIFCLEHYEEEEKASRRFELIGDVEGIEWDYAGAYLIGKEAQRFVVHALKKPVLTFLQRFSGIEAPEIDLAIRETGKTLVTDADREHVFHLILWFGQGVRQALNP